MNVIGSELNTTLVECWNDSLRRGVAASLRDGVKRQSKSMGILLEAPGWLVKLAQNSAAPSARRRLDFRYQIV